MESRISKTVLPSIKQDWLRKHGHRHPWFIPNPMTRYRACHRITRPVLCHSLYAQQLASVLMAQFWAAKSDFKSSRNHRADNGMESRISRPLGPFRWRGLFYREQVRNIHAIGAIPFPSSNDAAKSDPGGQPAHYPDRLKKIPVWLWPPPQE